MGRAHETDTQLYEAIDSFAFENEKGHPVVVQAGRLRYAADDPMIRRWPHLFRPIEPGSPPMVDTPVR